MPATPTVHPSAVDFRKCLNPGGIGFLDLEIEASYYAVYWSPPLVLKVTVGGGAEVEYGELDSLQSY